MYIYQPCLLTLSLYAWAFDEQSRKRWICVLFPLLILALSEWELSFSRLWVYPAALLPAGPFLLRKPRSVVWEEVLTAALLGGAFAWKAADTWPLTPVLIPLCAMLMLIPILLLCRGRDDRLLSCVLGGMLFELFFCLKEFTLFSYCVIRVGSRDSLNISVVALCLYCLIEEVYRMAFKRNKQAIPVPN